MDALPVGSEYTGPYAAQVNPCQCSTVVYSLVAACGVCQNRTVDTWSSWQFNCSQVYVSQYPDQIPSGTAFPAWAYLDVVANDTFNVAGALAIASAPASSATVAKPTGTVSSTSASSQTSTPASTPSTGSNGGGTTGSPAPSKKSNAGAIAGGVIGGIVGVAIIAGAVAFFLIRSRQNKSAPSTAYGNVYNDGPNSAAPLNTPPPMSQSSYMSPSPRLYDPSDPSTYPQAPQTPTIHTTSFGPGYQPSGPQPHAAQYSGVPEL